MPHTLPPVPPSIRFLTNAQSARVNSVLRTTSSSVCRTCKGKNDNTFRWYTKGREIDSVDVFECPCDDQWRLHRRFLHSGVLETYQVLGWEDFLDLNEDTAEWAFNYIDNAPQYVGSGLGAIIWGGKGNGKTLLATLIVKQLIHDGIDCYTNTFNGILEAFSSGWNSQEDKDWFNERIRSAPVLMIDDVGRERNRGAGTLSENTLESVLRYRNSRSMPTIITTNEDPEKFGTGYGSHTMSLLSERALVHRFEGKDRRPEINDRILREAAAGVTRPVMVG